MTSNDSTIQKLKELHESHIEISENKNKRKKKKQKTDESNQQTNEFDKSFDLDILKTIGTKSIREINEEFVKSEEIDDVEEESDIPKITIDTKSFNSVKM